MTSLGGPGKRRRSRTGEEDSRRKKQFITGIMNCKANNCCQLCQCTLLHFKQTISYFYLLSRSWGWFKRVLTKKATLCEHTNSFKHILNKTSIFWYPRDRATNLPEKNLWKITPLAESVKEPLVTLGSTWVLLKNHATCVHVVLSLCGCTRTSFDRKVNQKHQCDKVRTQFNLCCWSKTH